MADEVIVPEFEVERPTNKESWLAAKNEWLGASEVASLYVDEDGEPLGFDSPLTLLRVKAGVVPRAARPELEIYADMEESLLLRWLKTRPLELAVGAVLRNGLQEVYRMPMHPRLRATPDAFMLAADRVNIERVIQFKVTADSKDRWDRDGVPLHYLVQLQAEMFCTGAAQADIHVLFRCERPHMVDATWTVPADVDFQRDMLERVAAFWELVEAWRSGDRTRLPAMGANDSAALAHLVAARDVDEVVQLDEGGATLVAAWERAHEDSKVYAAVGDKLDTLEKLLRNKITAAMGKACIATLPDGRRLRVRSHHRDTYQVPSSDWIELGFLKEKRS